MTIQQQIEEALKKATPGPWKWIHNEGEGCLRGSNGWPIFDCGIDQSYYPVAGHPPYDADLEIITNAHEWLTHQQSIISQQAAEIAELKKLTRCDECGGSGINEMCHDPYYALPCACTVDWQSELLKQSSEINRLSVLERALIDFKNDSLPSQDCSAQQLYDWLESTAGFEGLSEGGSQ